MTGPLAIIDEAAAYVRSRMSEDSSGHDWYHVERVWKVTRRLAEHYEADRLVCELAALLHDLADEKLVVDPEAVWTETIEWMCRHQIEESVIGQITEIVDTMSFKGGAVTPMATLEGQIVQDADRLDALGAIGIGRTMAYSGWKGQLVYDPELPPRTTMTAEAYRKERSTAINHFHEKLFLLKDRMNTPLAKAWAKERHRFMEQFLEQYLKEWNAEDMI